MSRLIALVMVAVMTAGLLASPGAFAQATKDKPAKAEAKKAELIDINTASADELRTLKGIGDAYAKKIVENRPYKGKDELVSKKVIPQATYDGIKGQIIAKQGPAKK
jgi:DNA uptake protein ComE-like DNA-binding protein